MHEAEILNKILNGEKMAIEIIHTYMHNLEEPNLKATMEQWVVTHQRNADKISSYLDQKGLSLSDGTGMIGWMANTKAKVNTMFNHEPVDILHEIYDGEDKGIAKSVEISKENNLTPEATALIEEILSNDHTHLKQMKQFITQYENK